MSIDTNALDNAADTFSRSMRALNSMELADLPPELDQDARDIARIIQDHGKGYEGTEYGDMTAPLLESLARLVQAAKAADRLAELEAELASAREAERVQRERAELARVRELCPEVIAFAHLMQHKLNMNAHKDGEGWGRDSSGKRGWKSCSPQFLMDKLYEEVLELTIAIHEGDSAKSIRQEAADVGNIAMMLADVCGALSQPAEQHDPLAVSDHCGECGEPEPECACDERESLPLMARRRWMPKAVRYCFRNRDCGWFFSLNTPTDGEWEFVFRIADTDEHGLPVIERTADMPEDVTHMTLHTRRFFRAGELRARSVEGDEGLLRIEDYRESGQEGQP